MIGEFSYKGISSSNFNLVCKSVNRPLLPALKSNLTKLTGTSGVYDSGGTEYDLRNITMKIQYIGKEQQLIREVDDGSYLNYQPFDLFEKSSFYELRTRAREIAAWLGGGEWGKLIITGEEDKYYLAKIEEDIELDTIFDFGEADITFVCQPFAYSVIDLIFESTGDGSLIISNPGSRQINNRSPEGSLFTIEFTQNDSVATFGLNDRSISYAGNYNDTYVIDNVNMRELNGGLFQNFTGNIDEFLEIKPGDNTLETYGAIDIIVTIRPMYY